LLFRGLPSIHFIPFHSYFTSIPLSLFSLFLSFFVMTTPLPQATIIGKTTTTEPPPHNNEDESVTSTISRLSTTAPAGAAELARLTLDLRASLRQFQDFPTPGVLFEDIMPLFADVSLHESLIRALEIHCLQAYGADGHTPDVVVGLDARGFLFGPSLALRLGAGFVPVRKKGKLPGPTIMAGYAKEYGEDLFQIQAGSIKSGQRVLVVDDIIATGMCDCFGNTSPSRLLNS
jgi:adenine phosphoribosyltransferase